ncbi:hypothetical protein B8281_15890 [Cellulosimicrobium sp. TH-20]|uniref:hypothetical protein n=1 Tax=Cellulosimicrobium sp. TH-20 TaxID=1980001 RepID=UPI000A17C4AF|nr:hypothetical protein [Cellulosimicrobium sp. TH-20]ARK05976.1 hypothetical protein B8281_15890 [Cellulosimicrobium sp. TH-20]
MVLDATRDARNEAEGRVFLTTGMAVLVELRVVDGAATQWFEVNNFLLAWEMHVQSGRPMEFVVPANYREFQALGLLYASIALPSGQWLDIHGIRDPFDVASSKAWVAGGGVSQSQFNLDDPDHMHLLLEALGYMPGTSVEAKLGNTYSALEREVARDFARHLLDVFG